MQTLSQKITAPNELVVLYEIIPPPKKPTPNNSRAYAAWTVKLHTVYHHDYHYQESNIYNIFSLT